MSHVVDPTPHPAPSPDAHHAAVSTRQAALIGAVAVILSALIAIAASYISASLASTSTLRAASLQVSGENDRSRAEFLRGQRQVLYAQVLDHERALNGAVELYSSQDVDERESKLEPIVQSFVKAKRNFDDDESSIMILGSDGAIKQYRSLNEAYVVYFDALESVFEGTLAPSVATGSTSPDPTGRSADPVEAASENLRRERDAMLMAFRADMGAR